MSKETTSAIAPKNEHLSRISISARPHCSPARIQRLTTTCSPKCPAIEAI